MIPENVYKIEDVEDIRNFLIGGKAIMTLESKQSGRWFTYKIKKLKSDRDDAPFFVSVLTGQDNNSAYTYMGTISVNYDKLNFKLTKKSKIGEDALSYKAFNFFFNLLMKGKVHSDMNVYHKGFCAVCGRALTTPESILRGIGPYCNGINKKIDYKKLMRA